MTLCRYRLAFCKILGIADLGSKTIAAFLFMKLNIDQEFKSLIPPLTAEELLQLESNILAEGCRESLVTWRDTIIDGHNRYDICTRNSLPFKTMSMEFSDRDAVMLWMTQNQLGRRNLSDDQRAMIALATVEIQSRIEVRERNRANATKDENVEADASTTLSKDPKQRTRAKVAKQSNVSERKIKQAKTVKAASPEMAEKVHTGEMSLADAVREIKRVEVISKLEDVAAVEAKELAGTYDVIVIDPPWPMQKIERAERPAQVSFDYPTMDESELSSMVMPAADDCHLWLWTTHKFLPMALRLLDSWKFNYVCTFVWHKPGGFQPIGLPQYNCEFAMYARKGTPKFIDTKAFPVCFNAPRGAHSEKPEHFYDVVRRVTAGRRIDIFNRRKIEGFDVWGNES